MKKIYRAEIDGLRALAILLVIFFHAGFSWLKGGFLGVDVFFVISGYLITQIIIEEISENKFSFINFWLRRARRILPALICMTICAGILAWFLFLPNDFQNFGRSVVALSTFTSNIYFWLKSGYFTPPAVTEPLLHTWSLGVEEQFYLLFPPTLFLITRYAIKWRMILILLLMVFSLGLAFYEAGDHEIAAFFLLPMRAWELLMGSLIALYYFKNKNQFQNWANEILSVIGILMVISGVYVDNQNTNIEAWGQLLACIGTLVFIVSNQNNKTYLGCFFSLKPIVTIGIISYSMYLWHWPFFVFARYVSVTKLTTIDNMFILAASGVAAWISYRWIETPFRKKSIFAQPHSFVISTCAVTIVVALLGFVVDLKNGFPSRLNANLLAVYEKAISRPKPSCKIIHISKNLIVCSNANITQKPDLVIWGDSHAYMLLPLIEKLASRYHIVYWSYSCIPVMGVYDVSQSNLLQDSQCEKSNKAIIAAIKKYHVKNVLLASFWVQFVEGREIPQQGAGQRNPFYADEYIHSSTRQQARIVFKKHFVQTVHALLSGGAAIWILKQVPFFTYWPTNALLKTLRYGGDANNIGRPLSQCLEREKFVNSVFNIFKSKEIHFLNPNSVLCDHTGFCHGALNGQSLYFDFNHLSTYGVMQLKPLFIPMFVRYHDIAIHTPA